MSRWRWVAIAPLVLLACGGKPPPQPRDATPHEAVAPPLETRPLQDYIPAAGLRWLVVAQLAEIGRMPSVRDSLSRLFPDDRLDAYTAATGLDLRRAEEALVAGFDYGTVYLAETSTANARVEELFRNRLPAGAVEHQVHPDLVVLSGMIRETPAALVSERGHLVGVAFGDPTLARIVEAYALGRLESVTAMRGAALATLPARVHDAPVRFYAPGPFQGEWSKGGGGLLGAATAAAVCARPIRFDVVRIEATLAGDWSSDGERARSLGIQIYNDLAASPLGRLLALDDPVDPPIVTVSPNNVDLTVDLKLAPLVGGLHAAVSADLWELLDIGEAAPATPEKGSASH